MNLRLVDIKTGKQFIKICDKQFGKGNYIRVPSDVYNWFRLHLSYNNINETVFDGENEGIYVYFTILTDLNRKVSIVLDDCA